MSVLALLQMCYMTLCKAFSFFLQEIRLFRQALRSGIVRFNSLMFVNCYRSVFYIGWCSDEIFAFSAVNNNYWINNCKKSFQIGGWLFPEKFKVVWKWLVSRLNLMVCSFILFSVGEISRVNEKAIEGLGKCRSANPCTLL